MTNGDRVHKISLSSDSSEDEGDKDHTDQGPPAPEAVGAPVVAPMPFVIHPLLPTNTIFLNPFWTFHVADHYMVPLLGQQSPIASTTGPHLPGLLTTSESIEYQDHAGDEQQCNVSYTDEPFPVKLHQMMSDSSCSFSNFSCCNLRGSRSMLAASERMRRILSAKSATTRLLALRFAVSVIAVSSLHSTQTRARR